MSIPVRSEVVQRGPVTRTMLVAVPEPGRVVWLGESTRSGRRAETEVMHTFYARRIIERLTDEYGLEEAA